MSSTQFNNGSGFEEPLSIDTIRDWLEGRLPEEESQALEQLVTNDEWYSEALLGLTKEDLPALERISGRVNEKISGLTGSGASGGGSGTGGGGSEISLFTQYKSLFIGAVSTAVVGTGIFIGVKFSSPETEPAPVQPVEQTTPAATPKPTPEPLEEVVTMDTDQEENDLQNSEPVDQPVDQPQNKVEEPVALQPMDELDPGDRQFVNNGEVLESVDPKKVPKSGLAMPDEDPAVEDVNTPPQKRYLTLVNAEVVMRNIYASTNNRGDNSNPLFDGPKKKPKVPVAETFPTYPGGEKELKKYLKDAMRDLQRERSEYLPRNTVTISFVVTSKGKVTEVQLIQGASFELDQVSVALFRSMPDWEPAKGAKKGDLIYTMSLTYD